MSDTPITDAQVEEVARRFCVLMGLDPDAVGHVPESRYTPPMQAHHIKGMYEPGTTVILAHTVPMWKTKWAEVRETMAKQAMARAVREVMDG